MYPLPDELTFAETLTAAAERRLDTPEARTRLALIAARQRWQGPPSAIPAVAVGGTECGVRAALAGLALHIAMASEHIEFLQEAGVIP